MSETYTDALKRGQKEFRACIYTGEYPYLPRLDEFVPEEQLAKGLDLGLVQVPLELVVGTRSGGRTRAFARNFMPLLPDNSEFGMKWARLCEHHLSEGIRDPIKAIEYMNRFYVEEGNKRVSVLKFFNAVSVPAQVTRILPRRNGTREVEQYYEFVDFWQDARINFLELTKPGGYRRFQRLVGREPGEAWTDEDRSRLSAVYYYFRKAYEANGGKRLTTTVGDALLAYLEVYGYGDLQGKTEAEIKKSVAKVWEEITLQQEERPITVKLSAEETDAAGKLLAKVGKVTGVRVLRAAFIHDKNPDMSGWTYGHELGRQHLQKALDGEIETAAYFDACTGDSREVLECAIEDGNTILFTTSPRLLNASLRTAVEHPEITVLNCSLNSSHRYIRTYYARMYEVKFITGAIAGAMAEGTGEGSEAVGYLCDYPIFGQIAGINAFALGVQMTNPAARVYLEWSSVGSAEAALERLRARGVRLVSSQDLAKRAGPEETYGLALLGPDGAPAVNLAVPQWRWGIYYEQLIRRIRDKSFRSEYAESGRAVNYFWGLREGVVELVCSEKLPHSTRRLAVLLRESICSGFCNPFRGPLFSQDGRRMEDEQRSPGMADIIRMDWLNENIIGSIPAYRDLDETGRATVDVVGVRASRQAKEPAP